MLMLLMMMMMGYHSCCYLQELAVSGGVDDDAEPLVK